MQRYDEVLIAIRKRDSSTAVTCARLGIVLLMGPLPLNVVQLHFAIGTLVNENKI